MIYAMKVLKENIIDICCKYTKGKYLWFMLWRHQTKIFMIYAQRRIFMIYAIKILKENIDISCKCTKEKY